MKRPRPPAEPVRCLLPAILIIGVSLGLSCSSGCRPADPAAAGGSKADQKDSGQSGGPSAGEETSSEAAQRSTAADAPLTNLTSAQQVLDAMVAAYRNARTYSDRGTLRLQETSGGQKQDRATDYAIVLERPNKLRMHALRGVVVCDGKEFHAHFPELPDQLVTRPAPARMTIPYILSDAIFNGAISEGAPTHFSTVPPQLLLLLAKDPKKTILNQSQKSALLAPEKIGDDECYRVQLDRPDGKAVLWIDRRTLVLRRIEYPIEQMKKDAAEQKVELNSLVAEFQDAQIDGPIDEKAFQIDVPAAVRIVECLTPPPLLLAGKPAPDFRFIGPDNKPIDRSALQGKPVVLEFWNTSCDPWRDTLLLVEKVYQKYRDNPKVVFLAVSVDDNVPEKDLQAKMAQWQVTMPIARDPDQDAGKKFGVRMIPAMYLIGPNGTVQDYQDYSGGVPPSLESDLSAKIEKLLAGQDVFPELLRRWEEERKQYAASLETWTGPELYSVATAGTPEAPVKIAEPTKPKVLSLTPLWKCADVKQPGNLLVVPQPGGPPKLLVIDDKKSVVEVGPDGKRKTLYPLDIRPEEVVTLLRTGTDSAGKRYFVAAAMGGPRVHLFDGQWKRLLSIPEAPPQASPLQVGDAQLADLDGDGKPEILISYFGGGGVRAFSLDGKELWRNEETKEAPGVAVVRNSAGQQVVLCANERSGLLELDPNGKRLGGFGPERMFISIVAADLDADQTPALCGISLSETNARGAVFLGPKGEEKQTHALGQAIPPEAVEQVVPGHLAASGPGCWLLPGADGSIHVLDPEGRLVDQFNTGGLLKGLATLVLDGKPVLVVATAQGLEAWQVQGLDKPK